MVAGNMLGVGIFLLPALVAEHTQGHWRHDERLWSLINLEVWHRIFIDGEPPSAIETPTHGGRAG